MPSPPDTVLLVRYAYLPQATLGLLVVPDLGYALYTLERPWIRNPAGPGGLPRESCVPDGAYVLSPHSSNKFPGTFQLEAPELGVYRDTIPSGIAWGRTTILIHKANQVIDVIGCIGVGMRTVIYNDNPNILRSGDALQVLRELLPADRNVTLTIRPSQGTSEPARAQAPISA